MNEITDEKLYYSGCMKLLYIASSSGWGGGSVALFNLINGLKNRGHEILVLFPNGKNKRFCDELDQIDIPYSFANYGLTIFPKTRNPLKRLIRLLRIIRNRYLTQRVVLELINSFNPDIVHTNVGPLDIALSPCLKTRIPHVWHLREYQDLDFGMTSIPSKKYFKNRIHKRGNYNIAITNGVFSYWELDPLKDIVINDGVFSEDHQTIYRSKEKLILFVGRVEEAKGVDVIEPFSRIHELYPDYKFIIAGKYNKEDHYYQKCMKLIAEFGLSDNISFLGEITNVYEWMSIAKALVVPSRFEGFGFITVEAMLNNCFVVGRDTAGTKEQFDICLESSGEECAYRFTDTDGLFRGMRYAIENSTDNQCRLSQIVVRKRYTLENHCKKVEAYYERILSEELSKKRC